MFISDTQARTARTGSSRRRARVEKRGQWHPIILDKFSLLYCRFAYLSAQVQIVVNAPVTLANASGRVEQALNDVKVLRKYLRVSL